MVMTPEQEIDAAILELERRLPLPDLPTRAQSLRIADFREELAIIVAQRLGCTSDEVMCVVHVVVDALIHEYGGTHLYVPVPPLSDPIAEEVLSAIKAGDSHWSVRRRFGIGYSRLQTILKSA